METTETILSYRDQRARILEAYAKHADALALTERVKLNGWRGPEAASYAESARTFAEAHDEAAAVYRRRIAELS